MANGNHRIEDYLARQRNYLSHLFEGYQTQKTEFRKQIMTLSVAGLGFVLFNKPNNFCLDMPSILWVISAIGFGSSILLTLIIFNLSYAHAKAQIERFDAETEDLDLYQAEIDRLAIRIDRVMACIYLFFGLAILTGSVYTAISI